MAKLNLVVSVLLASAVLGVQSAQAAVSNDIRVDEAARRAYVTGDTANELYLVLDPAGTEDKLGKFIMLNPSVGGQVPKCLLMNGTNGTYDPMSMQQPGPARCKRIQGFIASVGLNPTLGYNMSVDCENGLSGRPSCVMYNMVSSKQTN